MKAEIRDARSDDVPGIQKVARTTWNDAYRGIIPEEVRTEFIGTRLLETGISRFRSATKVTLRVERENASARRFYESRGFAAGRHLTERFFGHEMHDVEMTLEVGKTSAG